MKQLTITLLLPLLVFAGCSSKNELTRGEALRLLQQSKTYPKVIEYDIYTSDPQEAKKMIDAGIEAQGLVTVQRTQKPIDAGKPLVEFTNKAQSLLLPTPEKDRAARVQKVKLADEEIAEMTGLTNESDGKHAVAEYTTTYKNVSGFAPLTKINFKQTNTRKANFVLSDDGWRLEKAKQD